MPIYIRELVVVLLIAITVFGAGKRIALIFMRPEDFSRRRNVWFALTGTAFLCPSFWIFALVAIPLLLWASRKDSNPVALYLLLLHVIPIVPIDIPVIGIHTLFTLDNYRLLSLCVLIPAAARLRRGSDATRIRGVTSMDMMLLGYGMLQVALFIPPDLPGHVILHDSFTNALRRALLFFVDVYVLYFVVSRTCSTRASIVEAQAAFCLASTVMAALAFFEFSRHWLLYTDIATRWSDNPTAGFYLMRGDTLRAQVTAMHPLALGFLLAIAFGFWLHLKSSTEYKSAMLAGGLLLCLGLLGAYSRGPWIGALFIYFAFAALGRRALSRLFRSIAIVALLITLVAASPLENRIVSVLPFLGGNIDSGSAIYRERVAERAWEIIKDSPILGDQHAYLKMEDLRQGQGIIDLVNTYAEVAVFYGLLGLSLFLGFILTGLAQTFRSAKAHARSDPPLAAVGVSLCACILGTLVMIASNSFGLGLEKLYYVLGGMAAGYAHIGTLTKAA